MTTCAGRVGRDSERKSRTAPDSPQNGQAIGAAGETAWGPGWTGASHSGHASVPVAICDVRPSRSSRRGATVSRRAASEPSKRRSNITRSSLGGALHGTTDPQRGAHDRAARELLTGELTIASVRVGFSSPGTTCDMDEHKGEWADVAEEGIAPVERDDAPVTGETTGSDEPATAEGIDVTAGDDADATADGGPPESRGEPDFKDATSGPRPVDADSARP
jgi:hypothetical protein